MSEAILPRCLSLMLCDAIHRDPGNGKFTLLGTFNQINAAKFPTKHPLAFYVALTDGRGKCNARIRIVEADKHDDPQTSSVFDSSAIIEFRHPLHVVEIGLQVMVHLERPGTYYCQIFCDSETLMERTLEVVSLQRDPPQP